MAAPVEARAKPSKQITGMPTKPRAPHHKTVHPAAAPAPNVEKWLDNLISCSSSGSFFNPCPVHKEFRKSEATLFCVDCEGSPMCRAMCQHCIPAHAGHRTIQIRRYVYCDVVRAADIAPFVDITGVQTYTINQAKVVFLNHRPQSKQLAPGAADGCAVCCRALREGCTYCSLSCKVEALVREGRLGRAAAGGDESSGCAAAPHAHAAHGPGGCCGESAAAAPATLLGITPLTIPSVASDSSDCCNAFDGPPALLGGPDALPRRSSCSGSGNSDQHHHSQQQRRRASGGCSSEAAWMAKRSSDSSCQSHLDWHSSNGHVCRRKQVSPRRSPLL